jgi:hypothetical protein
MGSRPSWGDETFEIGRARVKLPTISKSARMEDYKPSEPSVPSTLISEQPIERPPAVRRLSGRYRGGGGVVATILDEPHERRRGWLKNGNPSGDWTKGRRRGALTRRQTACQCPAIRNRRRCRVHGGMSTGPKTAAGLKRSRRARWKHGEYSAAATAERARIRALFCQARALLDSLNTN